MREPLTLIAVGLLLVLLGASWWLQTYMDRRVSRDALSMFTEWKERHDR